MLIHNQDEHKSSNMKRFWYGATTLWLVCLFLGQVLSNGQDPFVEFLTMHNGIKVSERMRDVSPVQCTWLPVNEAWWMLDMFAVKSRETSILESKMSATKCSVRSTLEEMLDSIKMVNDEDRDVSFDDKQKDLPPALPQRPISRARLPSTVRARKALSATLENIVVRGNETGEVTSRTADITEERLVVHAPSLYKDETTASVKSFNNSEEWQQMEVSDTSTAVARTHRPLVENMSTFRSEEDGHVYVGSPTFISAVARSTEMREAEGVEYGRNGTHGDAVETMVKIQRSSSADVLTQCSDKSSFSFQTSQDPPAPVISPSTGHKKWKDDGTPCLRKVCCIWSSSAPWKACICFLRLHTFNFSLAESYVQAVHCEGFRWSYRILFIVQNLRVWCLSKENIWISGVVLSAEGTQAVIRTSDGQVRACSWIVFRTGYLEGVNV